MSDIGIYPIELAIQDLSHEDELTRYSIILSI